MSIWLSVCSHRPQFSNWALFTAAYVVGCGFAKALAIVPGSSVSFWPPGGLLMATLMMTPAPSWPWWILGGVLAESFGQLVWFSSGLPIGFLIIAGNALEAMAGAWLVNRVCGRPVRLETLHEVLAFVVLGAGLAPVISATVGSATLAGFGIRSQTFLGSWPLWWIGDATGILIVAPLTLVVVQNWRGMAHLLAVRWIEVSVVGLTFLGVAALSLGGYLPFAYIVMPPLLWAAVRFDVKGAAITLMLLALLTVGFTLSGLGQFAGDPESQRHKQIMLHLFLAVSALSALIVAAISRQHQLALLTLRESERQLQQLINAVPAAIVRHSPDGEPTFVNRRMVDFLGLSVADVSKPDMSRLSHMQNLVHPGDAASVSEALDRAFATGQSYVSRYRLRRADGVYRWIETRGEPLRDQGGAIVQWHSVSIDIEDEVRALEALRRSERQLQETIDAVPVRIWSTTPADGRISFNKRYQDYLRSVIANFDTLEERSIERFIQELIHPEDAPGVQLTLQSCFQTGDGVAMRFRWREKDGAYRWAECRVEPRRDQDGSIAQWYGVSLDIDEEVRAQEALRAREREFSQLVNMVPIPLWRLTPDGEPTFFNKRLIDFAGLEVTDLDKPGMSRLAAGIEAAAHRDDVAKVTEALQHSLMTGESFHLKYRLRRADGVYRWMEGRAEPMRDEGGRIVQWYGLLNDIDDEVRAQQALRDGEREFSQLVNMVPSIIWRLSPDGEPNFFNTRSIDFLGRDAAEYDRPGMSRLAATLADIVHPDDAAGVVEGFNHSLVTGEPFSMTYRLRRVDDVYRWVSCRAEPMRDDSGRIAQWYGLAHDIDDQMRLYSDLAEREAKIRRLVDSDIIGIVIWDLDGRVIDANDAFLRMVQHEREDVKAGLRWFDITPPEWQEVHAREEADELARTGKMQAREKEYFRKDGSRVPVLIGAACFEGQSRQGVAYILDLSERKRAEAALRDRERELAQLVNMVPIYIRRLTPDGEPTFFNKRLTDFIGVNLTEIGTPGMSRLPPAVEDFVHPDEAGKLLAAIRHSIATGIGYAMKYRMRRADGVYRWLETRAEPVRHQDGTIAQWYVVSIDVDDEVRAQQAEETLRETSDKLAKATHAASLAELSASIAHEVNQPLAAIVANSHACQRWLKADPPNLQRAQITVERIIRDANSAADAVSHIRALFRQTVEPKNHTAFETVISEARNLVAEEAARRSVQIAVDVESELPLVTVDRVQVQQVLINLIRNGMEAMDAIAGDRTLGMRVRRMGHMVQTEISDRGRGIEFPEKMFEPFFTTKESGMGMGLTICRSIVESHGGRLWAQNNVPHGATLIFTLPIETETAHEVE